jgi:hypothetical protein
MEAGRSNRLANLCQRSRLRFVYLQSLTLPVALARDQAAKECVSL